MVRFTALPECAEGPGTRVRNMLCECGLTCKAVTVTANCLTSDLQMPDRSTEIQIQIH